MITEEDIVFDYLEGNLNRDQAIEDLIQIGLTAMEAERIIDDAEITYD